MRALCAICGFTVVALVIGEAEAQDRNQGGGGGGGRSCTRMHQRCLTVCPTRGYSVRECANGCARRVAECQTTGCFNTPQGRICGFRP
jgi:hypothetical protein